MNTLKEVIEALKPIDEKAALYLWDNFDEEDFKNGFSCRSGALRKHSIGPLDFFRWSSCGEFDWVLLNIKLKKEENIRRIASESLLLLFGDFLETEDKINLEDYIVNDIDFTGCHPVIAEALKQNKSILCKTNGGIEKVIVHYKDSSWPYVDKFGDQYNYAEPIKTKKTETRVKEPVEAMRWLVDNGWKSSELGVFRKNNSSREFDFRSISACGKKKPDWWEFPELLEEVSVIYKSDKITNFIDPFGE